MSYAIRDNGASWRAVNGPSDCVDGETWSATHPSMVAPMPVVVSNPPVLTNQQITKLADFLATNQDIAEALGIQTP